MSKNSRVIWSEGMFLRPQHFQQHDRFIEHWINGRCGGLRTYAWGFRSLQLSREALSIGRLEILESRGIFRDGTPFDMPDNDEPPLALEIDDATRNKVIYLAVPTRRNVGFEVDSNTSKDDLARYRIKELPEVSDTNSDSSGGYPVQIGKLKTRLLLESQERKGYHCLAVARVKEISSKKSVILDENFIPPVLACSAGGILGRYPAELQGLLNIRGDALAGRVVDAGRGGMRETLNFLLLQTVNRYEPVLEHLATSLDTHPEDFFRVGLELAGELSTFYKVGKRPIKFPAYNHDDLQGTFDPLMDELRLLLNMMLPENAFRIPLEGPQYGIYGARAEHYVNLLDQAEFVLAVKANLPPNVLQPQFPPQVKIGPFDEIKPLIHSSLPGIPIELMAVAPQEIRSRPGYSYFRLIKESDPAFWKKLRDAKALAIFIGGNFPDLELELWAIKSGQIS